MSWFKKLFLEKKKERFPVPPKKGIYTKYRPDDDSSNMTTPLTIFSDPFLSFGSQNDAADTDSGSSSINTFDGYSGGSGGGGGATGSWDTDSSSSDNSSSYDSSSSDSSSYDSGSSDSGSSSSD